MHFIHRLIPQTLFARFMLIIIVPTLIGQILAVFLFYDRHWYNVSYYTSGIIANEIQHLLEQYKNNDLKETEIVENYLNLSYQFYPKSSLPSKQPKISEELGILKNILNMKINKKNIVRFNQKGNVEVLFPLVKGLIAITFPAKLLMNPTVYIFILWLIFLTIILLSTSLIFSKNQIRSILALADAADQFGRGLDGVKTFKPTGAKEIRKAGIAFLKMKERIEKQISKRTTMLAMISHDLRTPLTRMKLQLALMDNSEETEGLKHDILTMQQMITSYLDFAKGESSEEFYTVNIREWLGHLITKWPHTNIELTGKIAELTQIKPNAFERAIANIINNAIKYATKIKISVYSSLESIIIQIEDNGEGVKDSEKLLVFKAFYRSDKSRSLDNASNVGLGLAIAKEIIIAHNGEISLEDSKDLGGALVKIKLRCYE